MVFDAAKIDPSDVTAIAIAGLVHSHVPLKERPLHVRMYERFAGLLKYHAVNSILISALHKRRQISELMSEFVKNGVNGKPIMFVEHHTAHAASAYYQRPWTDDTLSTDTRWCR